MGIVWKIFICLSAILIVAMRVYAISSTRISIMSFNIENGGTQVSFDKVIEAVKLAQADIVGIQEAWGNTCRLSKALGWKYCAPSHNIASRFPLFSVEDSHANYVLAEVRPGRFVAVANIHLPDEPYGPDLVKKGLPESAVIENSTRVQLPMALPYIQTLGEIAKKRMPVFLTGDFNSPSHLDWIKTTVNTLPNHRYAVAWPITKMIEAAGLVDSYRKIHTDPLAGPGYTWPAGRPKVHNTVDLFNPTAQDLPERLDFIFTGGPSKVIASEVVGEMDNKKIKLSVSPWPSDHRAVVSRFQVIPLSYAKKNLVALGGLINQQAAPTITAEKTVLHPGEPIIIKWTNAPGNRYDYISIVPAERRVDSLENKIRLYTHATVSGRIFYSAETAMGNWLDWSKSEAPLWPLAPGKYHVHLMLDDSYTTLASTWIEVKSKPT